MSAGLPGAIASVPDGLASGVLAGVNPVQGLYASFAGPVAGGLSSSTRLMVITTTSAAALAAGSAVEGLDRADRSPALVLLTAIAGGLMILAGRARLGRYTRFVSHSMMAGFLAGIAVNIVCSQIPALVGAPAEGSFPLAKALGVLVHPSRIDFASLLTGCGALALLGLLGKGRWALVSALVSVAVPTFLVWAGRLDGVASVDDISPVPAGLPLPSLPSLSQLTPELVVGAFAVAAIVLVQGAGVAEAAPNPDGSRSDADRDFVAQGAGNVAASLVTGMPVGGSVSHTALNVASHGRTRWAAIWSGVWVGAVMLVFSRLVGHVAMPTLAAVLIVAAVGSLRVDAVAVILRTGAISQTAIITTFLATLFLPVAAAVGIGVALSLLLQLNREALDLVVVRLEPTDDGDFLEEPAPATLPDHEITILDVYGSLFYAGAQTLQARLPSVGGAQAPVVVLRLRGRTSLGATSFLVLADYAAQLAAAGGQLYLSGLDPAMVARLRRGDWLDLDGPVTVFPATARIGASTKAAYTAGEAWLVNRTM